MLKRVFNKRRNFVISKRFLSKYILKALVSYLVAYKKQLGLQSFIVPESLS